MTHPNGSSNLNISGAIRLPPINGVDRFNYPFTIASNGMPIEDAEDVRLYVEEAFKQARDYFKALASEFTHIHE